MIFLLDTHLLLWAAYDPDSLSREARSIIDDYSHTLVFSAASIWEVAIKSSVARNDFNVDVRVFRRALLEAEYNELPITGAHTAEVAELPAYHQDPFDRLLVPRARSEASPLLTSDRMSGQYGEPTPHVSSTVYDVRTGNTADTTNSPLPCPSLHDLKEQRISLQPRITT